MKCLTILTQKRFRIFILFFLLLPKAFTYAQVYNQSNGTTNQTGQTYTTSTADESAVKITGGTYTISNSSLSSKGATSSSDNSSFYGLNAVMLAYTSSGSAVINSTGNSVSSTGKGANGIFAYGKAVINCTNDVINCTGQYAHGIMCSGGGTLTATNVTATTSGANSGVIATDRGSGTITVTGGTFSASGKDSPGIYSTGLITVSDATITSTGSEAVVIEGLNTTKLTNITMKGGESSTYGGVLVVQSMSGDADAGVATFSMTGGSFKVTAGPVFFVTNTTTDITLSGVALTPATSTILNAAATTRWGTTGSNGGKATFTAIGQTLTGDFIADAISTLSISLTNSSTLTGAINSANTAKTASVSLDAASTWALTANSYVSTFSDANGISGTSVTNITGNGYNVYYDSSLSGNNTLGGKTYSLIGGGFLLPLGTTGISMLELNSELTLNQNYPNPVKESTTVSYYLPSLSKVKLIVYNYYGKPVDMLVNENEDEGIHEIVWTPQLPNGNYIYVLYFNGSIKSKKMVISR
jgi:hypothetical protein